MCTTELAKAAALMDRFESRGVKVFALSIDSAESHRSWTADIESTGWSHGHSVSFPIIADTDGQIARAYEMFDPDEVDGKGNKLTARAVFFIKGKRLRASMLYPASSGRSFEEVTLRSPTNVP